MFVCAATGSVPGIGPRLLTRATVGLLVRQASIRQSHPLADPMLKPHKKARIIYGRSVPALMAGGIL